MFITLSDSRINDFVVENQEHRKCRKRLLMLKKDLRIRMDQWIVQARLAGGLDDETDVDDALQSAALAFGSTDLVARDEGTRKWMETGTRILSAFMVAAANTPTGSARALLGGPFETQRIVANLAKNESAWELKAQLQWAASLDPKVFAAALVALAL
ncbi:hypothetical protein [Loktanella sp. M215]|uniref:hypothetical protein n=1 Tax=Loktanella sp. M215 TaxID=2675431 RepID=UPI001F17E1E0|nr:hypothetical protein [Loktanella sp. M215]MCF7701693.1 hypothetical protein [Loktanella sp. M215]